jgi:CotH protein
MKARRTAIAIALLTGLLALAPASASAVSEPPPGEAGWMYDAGTVVAIELTLSSTEKAALEAEPDEYVKGTFSLAKTDGTPGGTETPVVTSAPVEIRLKGHLSGSFRTLAEKAAFKLKFKKSEPFLGLRKMTLNNMVEDDSFLHETLSYRVFRAAGVAAPRTGFAWVRLNGEDFGLYLNLENLDKVNLERWFGPFAEPQHLYEGESGVDVEPDRAGEFEVDEGSEADRSDLEALIESANTSVGPGWAGQVSSRIDLEEMTRMWAVEKYVGHWDGYSGEEAPGRPNNYYLYSDPAGRFQMLPWGTDNTWEPQKKPDFEGDAGLLFDDCEADPGCDGLYRQALREVGKVAAGLDLDPFAADLAERLEPWELLEQSDGRHEHDMAAIANGVSETREYLVDRPGELFAFVGPEPEPQAPPVSTGGPPSPTQSLYVGHLGRRAGALVTHLWTTGSGLVSLSATFETANGPRRACSAQGAVAAEGEVRLSCKLSSAVISRLRHRHLALRVRITFTPASGTPESALRRVSLPRQPGG